MSSVSRASTTISALRKDVQRLTSDVRSKASAADLAALSDEVSRLNKADPGALRKDVQRLTSDVSSKASADVAVENVFGYNDARPLNGIIAHLTHKCCGNVHKKGIVNVTGSSCLSGCEPENATDFGSDSMFYSNNLPNSWICYDFKEQRVTPTSYSIKSFGDGRDDYHPKSWVLEVSNDGSSWQAVDTRKDSQIPSTKFAKSSYVTRNFDIVPPPSNAFRFIRFRQTWKNHGGDHLLVISALELFGTLCSPVRRPRLWKQ